MGTNRSGDRRPDRHRPVRAAATPRTPGRRLGLSVLALVAVASVLSWPGHVSAGPGSHIAGTVWADSNRDGLRQPDEVAHGGVTVEVLAATDGAVVATTSTDGAGAYSFADLDDGDYTVRVTAPGAFRFPGEVSGDNDFVRDGAPNLDEPERGLSGTVSIADDTQVTGLDAGMQPIATIVVDQVEQPDLCEGLASTGTEPFDDVDGPGLDSGPGNCVVRTEDTVTQFYSVSLDGLPTNTSVDNVIAEFTISSSDGATFGLAGPTPGGLPEACLTAAEGANPPSSQTRNPDGSITLACNLGTFVADVASMRLIYRVGGDSAIPSHTRVTMHAYAASGDAVSSETVQGPLVAITGNAQWDLSKQAYRRPVFRQQDIDGELVDGYYLEYQFRITDTSEDGTGGGELEWPVTFSDRMSHFPDARIVTCRRNVLGDAPSIRSPWTPTCEQGPQGSDGWQMTIGRCTNDCPPGPHGDPDVGIFVVGIFIPQDDMNLAIDPTWEPDQDYPTGTLDYLNEAIDTDDWTMFGGQPNYGDGYEPGWDGTEASGNNVVDASLDVAEPQWDLAKSFFRNFGIRTFEVAGVEVEGYLVDYLFNVRDLAGPENVAPWLDWPLTFTDRLIEYPDAVLRGCFAHADAAGRTTGTATCEPGPQPDGGWDISWVPNDRGLDLRQGLIRAQILIPLDDVHPDPCSADPELRFHLTNEAINTDHWTAGGQPNNGTGLEPGWDGEDATGNNLVETDIVIRPANCGGNPNAVGEKTWHNKMVAPGSAHDFNPIVAGKIGRTQVRFASNADARVTNPMICDVFDVSILGIVDQTMAWPNWTSTGQTMIFVTGQTPDGDSISPADFVVEYAIGPNSNDTQAGEPVDGVYPVDPSGTRNGVESCQDDTFGPWETDPSAFGPDWQDHVNMVRARPVDPALVVAAADLRLQFEQQARAFYNGGPNAGELIPPGVWVYNHGGRSGLNGTWATNEVRIPTGAMRLFIEKSASPTSYVPGADVVWNVNLRIDDAALGSTMQNLQVVDTLPADMHYDAACTQDLLPDGVAATYSPAAHQVTFTMGDVPIEQSPTQWLSHSDPNIAPEPLRVCGTVDSLAQPGGNLLNTVQATADNSQNAPTAQASVQVVGSGQMGIRKSVDRSFVASGESYTWLVRWGNTSPFLAVANPDVIDVLPFNGDGDDGVGAPRDQFSSDYTGTAQLTGPLSAPEYVSSNSGSTGEVPGVWYYATAAPASIVHDARHASNAAPETPGGLWLTDAEIGDFSDVTAVRFVSGEFLRAGTQVEATIPAVSTSTRYDNVYVNRAMIFSTTFANQPLASNEPYVLIPGFTLGDLVWRDDNGDGIFDTGETPLAGVPIQVLGDDEIVALRDTDAEGRWSVSGLPAGTYRVRIPSTAFASGGVLDSYRVSLAGSSDSPTENENVGNNNAEALDPSLTGVTSHPVTLDYIRDDGNLVGANGPLGDNVVGLGDPLIPDEFTNFTIDLALAPEAGVDIEKATNGEDADEPRGPEVLVGDPVTWTYVVTNTGITPLTDVSVTDDMLDDADIDCGDGTNVVAGPVEPEDTFTCVATGVAIAGQYANLGRVVGEVPDGTQVTDSDPSHYFSGTPAVSIEKATNGEDADEAPGPFILVGDAVTWTYLVTNTGGVSLTDVAVTDDMVDETDIDCGDGTNIVAGPIEPEDTFTCTATGTAVAGQYANIGTVVATPPGGLDPVTDIDLSHYVGAIDAEDPPVVAAESGNGTGTGTVSGAHRQIPRTGSDADRLAPIGAVLVALGGILIGASWYRRRTHRPPYRPAHLRTS